MWFRTNDVILPTSTFCLAILSSISCTPFLHNAPSALINFAASALSSASSQPQPYTNIADLRRRHEKAQQMENKDVGDEDAVNPTPEEELDTNEVTPNIFQKKLSKILAKLKLISELSKVFINFNDKGNNDTLVGDNDGTRTTTVQNELAIDSGISNVTSENSEDVEDVPKQTLQKTIYRTNDVPIKFTLDIKRADENGEDYTEKNETSSDQQMNRFGQVGVFLAEVLGSVVALTYGAVIQFNHLFNQQNTEPPPA